jgi:hypothetical protein
MLSGSLQLRHGPEQATSQQTPSTQNPDMHCSTLVQAAPGPRLPPQALPEQQMPSRQVPVLQSVSHAHGRSGASLGASSAKHMV